jgi:hypothetical protein
MTSNNEQLVPVEQIDRESEYIIAGPWLTESDDESFWHAEVQIIGGHSYVAQIYAGSEDQAREMAEQAIAAWTLRTPPAVEPDEGLVEKVAMALCENALGGKQCPCKQSGKFTCSDAYPGSQARAVISTLTPSIRAQALEEAAKVADAHASNAWEIADRAGQNPIVGSGRNWAGREIASAIRALKGGQGV